MNVVEYNISVSKFFLVMNHNEHPKQDILRKTIFETICRNYLILSSCCVVEKPTEIQMCTTEF